MSLIYFLNLKNVLYLGTYLTRKFVELWTKQEKKTVAYQTNKRKKRKLYSCRDLPFEEMKISSKELT